MIFGPPTPLESSLLLTGMGPSGGLSGPPPDPPSSASQTVYRMPVLGDTITVTPPTGPSVTMEVVDEENPGTPGHYFLDMTATPWADEAAFAADVAGSVNYINAGGAYPPFELEATGSEMGAEIIVTGTSPGTITLTTNGSLFTP